MFTFLQFKLPNDFQYEKSFKSVTIRFNDVLRKNKEEISSLKKIIRLVSILKDVIFKNLLQNYRYKVIRFDNNTCDFPGAYFPLMNL